MPYDGFVIKNQINELKKNFLNECISKIVEPDNNTLQFLIKKNNIDFYLTFSINPNYPYIIFSNKKSDIPERPQAFCMLLRKHINGGRIIKIEQINGKNQKLSFERIIDINIKNINPKGEVTIYHLIIELMGRYSNIFFTNENYIIIDIFHKYFENNRNICINSIYNTNYLTTKNEIYQIDFDNFINIIKTNLNLQTKKNIINVFIDSFYGISKNLILNILNETNIEENELLINLNNNKYDLYLKIYKKLMSYINCVINNQNIPCIFYENNKIKDFYVFDLKIFNEKKLYFNSINDCINKYLDEKFNISQISIEKNNIENKILNLIKKTNSKIEMLEKDINLSNDLNTYKNYGDLLLSFGFDKNNIKNDKLVCKNYNNDNEIMLIPIDTNLSIQKNAEKYYKIYNKKKRTIEKSNELLKKYNNEVLHLNSILSILNFNNEKNDLNIIKFELNKFFNEKNKNFELKKMQKTNFNIKHFISSSNIDIYVGKNNIQNDYLTFELAKPNDTWFHVKSHPGSHVILKANYNDVDIKTIEEAASVAAFYSSLKNETKVTVDYTLKKEIKKVKNKPLGFVIYHKNYSINVKPEILIKEKK